jgi:hypothetical protein
LRRKSLLTHVIEEKTRKSISYWKSGRKYNQLLDDLKETRGYWKLKKEALDRTLWRTSFRRNFGPVVKYKEKWKKDSISSRFGLHWPFSKR